MASSRAAWRPFIRGMLTSRIARSNSWRRATSSAIVTKLLIDLRRVGNDGTPMILGIIVVEDVFLASYLALLQPLLRGHEGVAEIAASAGIAFGFLIGLFALARWGARLVRPLISSDDAELTVILVVGFGVFVAGFADGAGASDAVGALLAGMVVAGTGIGHRVEQMIIPLRDVFAAIFFLWFGTTIAPTDMGAIALPVAIAVVITLTFNVIAGVVAARIYDYGRAAATNTALLLMSRGEFELILASLAVAAGLDDRVAPFAALYVLVLSILSRCSRRARTGWRACCPGLSWRPAGPRRRCRDRAPDTMSRTARRARPELRPGRPRPSAALSAGLFGGLAREPEEELVGAVLERAGPDRVDEIASRIR